MFRTRTFTLLLSFLVALVAARPTRVRCATCHRSVAAVIGSASASVSSTSRAAPINAAVSTGKVSLTSTSSSAQSTKVATPAPPIGSALQALFPVPGFSQSWTTSPSSGSALGLTDSTFCPFDVLTSVSHTYVNAPDGKASMKAHYPKGSYNFGHNPQGGFSFYAPGPAAVDLTTAKEATFGYSVFFPKGFAFNLGGKLPGLYGGNSAGEAINCSGGSRSAACFSARLMWRDNGKGEFYTYLPPYTDSRFAANKNVCNVPPLSDCNPTYGASIGRGAFTFATGAWTTISERVRLNDAGQANGELELFVNGRSVIKVGGLILRDSAAGRIRGMQMQTFFGGSHIQFATPKDQDVYFSDFSVAISEKL